MSRLGYANPIEDGLRAANYTHGLLSSIDDRKRNQKREDELFSMKKEEHRRSLAEYDRRAAKDEAATTAAQDNKNLMMLFAKQNAARKAGVKVDFADEEIQLLQKNNLLNVDYLMSDEVGQALEVAGGVFSGKVPLTSPEAAAAMTTLSPDLQKGSPGKKTINAIIPGQGGTLMFDLAVDGKPGFPLTERRSADEDDPVKQVPAEAVIQRIKGVESMRKFLSTKEGQKYLDELYYSVGGGERPTKTATPSNIGKLISERDSLPADSPDRALYSKALQNEVAVNSKGTAAGQPPSDYKMAKLIQQEAKAEGKKMPFERALAIAKEQRSNLVKEALDYAAELMQQQVDAGVYPEDEGYKSREELEELAMQSVMSMRERIRGSSGDEDESDYGGSGTKDKSTSTNFDSSFWNQFIGDDSNSVPGRPQQEQRTQPQPAEQRAPAPKPQSSSRPSQETSSLSDKWEEVAQPTKKHGGGLGYVADQNIVKPAQVVAGRLGQVKEAMSDATSKASALSAYGRAMRDARYYREPEKHVPLEVLANWIPYEEDEKEKARLIAILNERMATEQVAQR